MSGLHEVDCGGCGQRHVTSVEQARKQRVLRCACGQFVRLDRALAELRSDPAPSQPAALASADEGDEEEQTHMVSSLAAVAALRGHSRPRVTQPSLQDDERISRPVPRSTLRSLPPSPSRPASTPPPPGDKPLWYVDLGGSETVEMTIEQLIVARRSGKLGEGALVWREGMPRWRPVGTLIPATSVAARQTPPPPAPSRATLPPPAPSRPPTPAAQSRPAPPAATRPAMPSRVPEALPQPSLQSLASYEKPLATLEFALEKSDVSAPREVAASPLPAHARTPSPLPNGGRTPSRPPRAHTPVPPVPLPATWSSQPPAPAASAGPPALAVELPPPPPPPPTPRRATPLPTPLPSFTVDRATQPPSEHSLLDWLGDRPRWVSACIALLICVTASGSGAFLVRSLKQRRQPLALASSVASQPSAAPSVPAVGPPLAPVPAAAARQPLVVDLESLSVEHSARHPAARWVTSAKSSVPDAKPPSDENAGSAQPTATASALPKDADLPSAARANPYTAGSDDSSASKPATGGHEPGF